MNRASWMNLTIGTLLGVTSCLHAADKVDFNRDIRPLLSNLCYKCHGPDQKERKGGTDGLRLDTQEGAFADQGGTRAIVPGKAAESELIRRVTSTDENEFMPPKGHGRRLKPAEVELLTKWINQGANYAKHWSYAKPVRPQPPEVHDASWPKNAIDRFLLARLEREGLQPSAPADREAIVRRVSLDLTGLPPTLAEVDEFVNDLRADAYEQLVDRLLKKDSFGEHWARMWLDLARYADSAGYADDPTRTIWAFRDYVIRSFNANKPFDQFTVEQLAGDLLPNPTEEQLLATAFHRNTLTNSEGGTNDEEFRNVAIVDRVNTTWSVWMGTSMTCCQCHNHKYDPISQQEFFRFFAILNNTEDADRRDEAPLLDFFTADQTQRKAKLESDIRALEEKLHTSTPELLAALEQWDRQFPRELQWNTPAPTAKSKGGAAITVQPDNSVLVAAGQPVDTYEVELTLAGSKLTALRLEALTHDSLSNHGPGHADGNFVLSKVSATMTPPSATPIAGRFVRIEIPGKQKTLSLAEVQIFQGANNLALKGTATQSSTAFDGPAKYAIDGNTDGKFDSKSVTHTDASDDPWWEVDLQSVQGVDRIVIWNRTDAGVEDRLADFRVALLNEQRQPVWENKVAAAPKPSSEFATNGVRAISIAAAVADVSQDGFDPQHVLNNPDPKTKGWGIGGHTAKPHTLTLLTAAPIDIVPGTKLTLQLEQQSKFEKHTLGCFRVSVTDNARIAEFARTPANILAILSSDVAQRSDEQRKALTEYYLTQIAPLLQSTRDQLAAVKKQLADLKPNTVPIMRELAGDKRRKTNLQYRGNFLDLGQEVTPAVPEAFHPMSAGSQPAGSQPDRLAMAKWMVDPNNPLMPRVIANRFWEQIFGIGLVRTSEEFGSQGELPSHPELLDWLAVELVESGWNVKHFLKLLVTSAAYRQSSKVLPEVYERDPENRLLARGPRFRLSAEMVRDQALFVSGLLSSKMYGPSVKPPQPALGLNAAFGSAIDWKTSDGEDRYRRGLYTEWRRSNPYPSMITFDAPNREVCTIRRARTNTPLQALVTMNDPVYIESAQALARRIVSAGTTPADKARFAFRVCLSRAPYEHELQRMLKLFEDARAEFAKSPDQAKQMATNPLGPAPDGADLAELAAWTVVGNVILNLDEMLMKR